MKPGIFNIFASFLLLAAAILLIIASISAPVVNGIGILAVDLPKDAKGDKVNFGAFGYCIEHGGDSLDDLCSRTKLGYSPLDLGALNIANPTTYSRTTTRSLTRVMILHPIGAALGAGSTLGHALTCLASGHASLVAALAMVSDFVLFGTVRAVVNEDAAAGSSAHFGAAMWCTLVAAVCSAAATLVVVGVCCVGRPRGRRGADAEKTADGLESAAAGDPAPAPIPPPAAVPTPAPGRGEY